MGQSHHLRNAIAHAGGFVADSGDEGLKRYVAAVSELQIDHVGRVQIQSGFTSKYVGQVEAVLRHVLRVVLGPADKGGALEVTFE